MPSCPYCKPVVKIRHLDGKYQEQIDMIPELKTFTKVDAKKPTTFEYVCPKCGYRE